MGRLGRDHHRRKLERMLASTQDEPFLHLIWKVHALQSGRGDAVRETLDFPPLAETSDIAGKFYVYPWNLETLANEVLASSKVASKGRSRILRCDTFETIRVATNIVRALENAEDAITLDQYGVFAELNRSIQRQFEWQRGFTNLPRFYRSAFLFGGPEAARHFEETHGLTISDFMLAGFGLFSGAMQSPSRARDADMTSIGVSAAMREATLALVSRPHAALRERAVTLRKLGHTAYRHSVLRDYPIIAFGPDGERLAAPLPMLIVNRVTTGVYLDVVGGGNVIWNEIGHRFENYSLRYLRAMLPGHVIEGDMPYGPKKAQILTPDVRVKQDGVVVLVGECKAKRMTFHARYSEDPVRDASIGYAEMAKAVYQIWRYFSHARRGMISDETVADDAVGLVMTLDPWLNMSRSLQNEIYAQAIVLAAVDPEITEADRRRVVFAMIDDIEYTLQIGTPGSFLSAVRRAATETHQGWLLSVVHSGLRGEERPYPFTDKIQMLLPWWPERETDRD